MTRLAAILLAVAIAGCGSSSIDSGRLEDDIKADFEREGLVIDGADCPSPEFEEGGTFECTVTVKGEDKTLEVEQRNDDGNVGYDLGPILQGEAGSDAGGDEASVRFVIDAVNDDVTALCDYATPEFRREIARQENCAKAVLAEYDGPLLEDYAVSIDEDTAAAVDDDRRIALQRQRNGSWLITDVR